MGSILIFRMILFVFEITCCVYAFKQYKHLKHSVFKVFPFYLLLIVICEGSGHLMILTGTLKFVAFLQQVVFPAQFLFFMLLLICIIAGKIKSALLTIPIIYIVILLIENFILPQKHFYFLSLSICIGCIGLLVLIFKYYSGLIVSDKLVSYKSQLSFWIATGLMIYFLGSLPFFGMFNILVEQYRKVHYAYFHIVIILSMLMYCSFILGLYFSRNNK